MKQPGPHSLDVDALMGNELDQLAQVIAGALHEHRPQVGPKPGPNPVPAGGKDGSRSPDQDLKSKAEQDPSQSHSERMKESGASL